MSHLSDEQSVVSMASSNLGLKLICQYMTDMLFYYFHGNCLEMDAIYTYVISVISLTWYENCLNSLEMYIIYIPVYLSYLQMTERLSKEKKHN